MPPPELLIRAGWVVTGLDATDAAEVRKDAAIHVRDGLVAGIGPAAELIAAHPGLSVHGGDDHVALPGLVNAHHHQGLTPLQLGVPTSPLETWLPRFMGAPDIDPRLDTLYSAVEMLESGVTTVQHIQGGLFGPPEGWQAAADAVMGAYVESGMRASWCAMIRDRNRLTFDGDAGFLAELPNDLAEWLAPRMAHPSVAEAMRFVREAHERWAGEERIAVQLAPANLHWCSDECLGAMAQTARDLDAPMHMHLDETRMQAEDALARTGRSAIAHLQRLGLLGPDMTLGHAIWSQPGDLDLLADHGCTICHNPSSGLRLASGIAPVNAYRARGIPVALGIDESGVNDDRDMLQEMRMAWLLHREPGLFRDRPTSGAVLRMATEAGARTTGFAGRIGRLAPGMAADVVTLSRERIARGWLHPEVPILDAVIERAKPSAVDEVFVGGRLCVSGGRVTLIDRDGLMAEIAARLDASWRGAPRAMAHRVARAVAAHTRWHGEGERPPDYAFNRLAERGSR